MLYVCVYQIWCVLCEYSCRSSTRGLIEGRSFRRHGLRCVFDCAATIFFYLGIW